MNFFRFPQVNDALVTGYVTYVTYVKRKTYLAPPQVRSQSQRSSTNFSIVFVKHGVCSHTHLCVITDRTATFYALSLGQACTSRPVFLRLLRRIWRFVTHCGIKLAVALTPSSECRRRDLPSSLIPHESCPSPLNSHSFTVKSV